MLISIVEVRYCKATKRSLTLHPILLVFTAPVISDSPVEFAQARALANIPLMCQPPLIKISNLVFT
jgi:hypothetical protein